MGLASTTQLKAQTAPGRKWAVYWSLQAARVASNRALARIRSAQRDMAQILRLLAKSGNVGSPGRVFADGLMWRLPNNTAALLVALCCIAAPLRMTAQTPAVDRPVSWKLILPNTLDDQKHIWSFPAKLAHGHDWIATATILGAAAGLVALDPTEGRYFRRTSAFQGFNNVFTSNATVVGTIVAPVSLYGVGFLRKDSKMQHTALLAGEAVANAEILTTVLKDVTRRARPASIPPGGNYSDTWFESGGSALRGNGSFPSGHTIAAFSVATVVARRYGNCLLYTSPSPRD